MEESADVSNMSQLIEYAWYIMDDDIKGEFLFCKPLQTMTEADDTLRLGADFFEKHQIKQEKLL